MSAENISLVRFEESFEHPYIQLLLADMEDVKLLSQEPTDLEVAFRASMSGLLGEGAHGIRELESPLSD